MKTERHVVIFKEGSYVLSLYLLYSPSIMGSLFVLEPKQHLFMPKRAFLYASRQQREVSVGGGTHIHQVIQVITDFQYIPVCIDVV